MQVSHRQVGPGETTVQLAASQVTVELTPGSAVLRGRLDVHSVADVRLLLHAVMDRGSGELVLDVGDMEVGDATGLGLLVGLHRRADRAGRRLVLRAVPPRLDRLLRLSRLHRILHVEGRVGATV